MKLWTLCIISAVISSNVAWAGGKSCRYVFQKQGTELEFTAFKFSEKAAVKGTFNDITFDSEDERTLEEAAAALEVKIDTRSLETKDPGRNANIVKNFFELTPPPHRIEAEVESMKDGKAQVEIEFNGVTKLIPMTYTVDPEAGTVEFKGESDMDAFNLGKVFKHLAEVCKGLHTGKDGKSVSWPDFQLRLLARFEKACG